ncbi:MAG TPA: ABC transporter family substrate-binding protein [Kineosporiaceae bacterium]|nr:ABC transporter family substrate-binding protein [Kineosporiaceae bacterium]
MSSARPWPRLSCALIVAALVLLAGCTGSGGDKGKDSGAAPTRANAPVTVAYAHAIQFNSYNNNTADQASVANSVVLNQVLRGFWYSGPDGELVPDTEFGTFKQVTGNPLTVRYTFDAKAKWSDGNPIDCDDAVLAWAANSGRWPTGDRDPDTAAKLTAFSSSRPGAWSNVESPQCADGDRSFTVTYDTVYADWASLFGAGSILPAHIVEKESRVADIIAAVKADSTKTMIKVGDVYNSLWIFKPGQYKTGVSPSAGPYQVSGWDAGQSITLKANPKWWGSAPKAATVVIRFLPPDQQVEALRKGVVQVIDPQPTTELLAQLKEASSLVKPTMYDSFTWEHLDFNFDGLFKSSQLRKAFAKCVPRQQIVDNLVKPQNPQAQVLQSRFKLPFQPGYDEFTNLGGQNYTKVDLAGAKKILQAEGKLGVKVKLAYATPNPRRKAEVDLIRDFCGQAGFKVIDGGSSTFFGGPLVRGEFDVALFAWTGSPLLTQSYATYLTRGAQNNGNYSNPQVDQLLKQLYSELNPANQQRLLTELDSTLWSDLATMPLFAFPAMVATVPNIVGVRYNPSASGITYNVNEWVLNQ